MKQCYTGGDQDIHRASTEVGHVDTATAEHDTSTSARRQTQEPGHSSV